MPPTFPRAATEVLRGLRNLERATAELTLASRIIAALRLTADELFEPGLDGPEWRDADGGIGA